LSSVVVIGGGISGIQASLDLADRGIKVYLVESSTSIGGTMAKLDKTFPTLDCSICILGPKMVEVDLSPNIELLTYSEVTNVEGSAGNFRVTVHRKPRFVNESCNGCGACAERCPVEVPNEYDEGLRNRKAIYIPFPQAIPLRYTIDREACVGCRRCVEACTGQGNDAIDFDMTAEDVELNVSAIIVATGIDGYLPVELGEYGYAQFPNVLTALEFERLICASGPTGGRLEKPFDGKPAHKIVFVQCVGSRSQRLGVPYCSSVCCMYATKESILVKEHDPDSEVTIFYVDLKVFGQGFQDFVDRARDHWGVEYIRGRPGEVREHPITGDLTVWYEDTDTGIVSKKEADLVVLCSAMIPRPGNKRLAEILGVELDEYGFFKVKDPVSNPVETGILGIYVCGCCHGPKDIPESVAEASATAAIAAEVIEGATKEGQ